MENVNTIRSKSQKVEAYSNSLPVRKDSNILFMRRRRWKNVLLLHQQQKKMWSQKQYTDLYVRVCV